MSDNIPKKWAITIIKKLIKAENNENFQIIRADPLKLDIFYILIKPTNGIYKDQNHILEFKTRYGSSNEYLFPFSPPSVKFITSNFSAYSLYFIFPML